MASVQYGYRYGERMLLDLPVKAAETWESGDAVKLSSGYLAKCTAGDSVYAIAHDAVVTAPTSNGDLRALVDISEMSVYEWPVGAGTITQAMQGQTCDISGSQGLDVTASSDDCVLIVRPNVAANTALIQIRPAATGVV